jgi:UDP-glucose 4-epimerase
MATPRTVLVTGASRPVGARLARALASDSRIERVLALDTVPPRTDIGRAEFVRADLRTPTVSRVVRTHDVDTVVHAGVLQTPSGAGSRAAMKEINVLGTLQLIAACQRAPSVQRFVLKSTTAVYGSGPGDPAVFVEGDDVRADSLPRSGFPRDSVDVEDAARRLGRLRPDISICLLRLANIVGPRMDTPLMRYLRLPVVPTVLGFDARLQLLHEDDAVRALEQGVFSGAVGAINVAGDGVLMLSQVLARLSRPGLPMPSTLGRSLGGLLRRAGLVDFAPEDVGFLTYGRVVDTTRMRRDLGLDGVLTTAEVVTALTEARAFERPVPLGAVPTTDAPAGGGHG